MSREKKILGKPKRGRPKKEAGGQEMTSEYAEGSSPQDRITQGTRIVGGGDPSAYKIEEGVRVVRRPN